MTPPKSKSKPNSTSTLEIPTTFRPLFNTTINSISRAARPHEILTLIKATYPHLADTQIWPALKADWEGKWMATTMYNPKRWPRGGDYDRKSEYRPTSEEGDREYLRAFLKESSDYQQVKIMSWGMDPPIWCWWQKERGEDKGDDEDEEER